MHWMAQLRQNVSRRYCAKQLLFWSGYFCYAILLEFASFKEWKTKKKISLSKQKPQIPYISQLSWYFSTWTQSIQSNSKILALSQTIFVALGCIKGPNRAWWLRWRCLVEQRGFNSLNKNDVHKQKIEVEFTNINNVLTRHMSNFNNSL